VRRYYEHRQSHGDFLEEIIASDFVWDMSKFRGWPEQQVYEGIEEARRFIREWTAAFDDWEIEVDALHDAGEDRVVGILRQRGHSKTTGLPVEMQYAQVFTIRDGKETRMEMYADADEALKAVGLAEQPVSANLELVRSIYADWERGEFSATPNWADSGMEFEIPDGPEPSTRTGIASTPGVEAFLELWEHLRFEAEEYRELDDGSVLALSRMMGRGKGSGVDVDQPRASLFHVSNGKVTRLVLYWDRERALADLGLAPEGG